MLTQLKFLSWNFTIQGSDDSQSFKSSRVQSSIPLNTTDKNPQQKSYTYDRSSGYSNSSNDGSIEKRQTGNSTGSNQSW